jgi:hypothetical protein
MINDKDLIMKRVTLRILLIVEGTSKLASVVVSPVNCDYSLEDVCDMKSMLPRTFKIKFISCLSYEYKITFDLMDAAVSV